MNAMGVVRAQEKVRERMLDAFQEYENRDD